MFRVLLAMPDDAVSSGLTNVLTAAGHSVTLVVNPEDLDRVLSLKEKFDLIVVDLQIQPPGREIVRDVREKAPQTSLILIAEPGIPETALLGLRYRAQDVIARPVTVNRLEQRVRRILFRLGRSGAGEGGGVAAGESGTAEVQAVSIGMDVDFERRLIEWDGQSVALTGSESRLLRLFFENPGRVLSHVEIVRALYEYETSAAQAASIIRPLVSRLRRKLESVPGGKSWIQSVRGVGYIYEPGKSSQEN
jgi:DNA-binding response OmpR family regulator